MGRPAYGDNGGYRLAPGWVGSNDRNRSDRWVALRWRAAVLGVVLAVGCAEPEQLPCEEDTDAARLPRIAVGIGETERMAEVADDEQERMTAWAGRRCDLDALLWIPAQVEPAQVQLCEVEVSVDLAFVFESEIVAIERERAPCASPCEACPVYGAEGPPVEAVVWLIAGSVELAIGDPITGLEQVMLPSLGGGSSG